MTAKINTEALWSDLFRSVGLCFDFAGFVMPKQPEGLERGLIIPKNTLPEVLTACGKHFEIRSGIGDIVQAVKSEDRSPNERAYGLWAHDCRKSGENTDPDPNGFNHDESRRKFNFMTLKEWLVFNLAYSLETGQHLDSNGSEATFCLGSQLHRDAGYLSPRALSRDGVVHVIGNGPGGCYDQVYSRVVSV